MFFSKTLAFFAAVNTGSTIAGCMNGYVNYAAISGGFAAYLGIMAIKSAISEGIEQASAKKPSSPMPRRQKPLNRTFG